jgi:trans-aconitate 2-methyltransferase
MKSVKKLFYCITIAITACGHFTFAQDAAVAYWQGNEYAANAQLQMHWADKFFFQNYQFLGTEHVLDIGCGDGRLTARIADAVPQGTVIGFDKSGSMIETAKQTFKNKSNLRFLNQDAQDAVFYKQFPEAFDLVTSFTVLHWVPDQKTVLNGILYALKRGGKFYLRLCSKGGDPIQTIADDLKVTSVYAAAFQSFQDPMIRYSPQEYADLIRGSGLFAISIEDVEERDQVANTESLLRQLKSWLPHYHHLKTISSELAERYMNDIVNRYLQLYPPIEGKGIVLYDHYLEVVGVKP